MNHWDECNGPCKEESEPRNPGPHSSLLRDIWTSFEQPALRQKKVKASLEFISFPFIICPNGDRGWWWWAPKSLKIHHLFTSTLKEKAVSQYVPTLSPGVKDLLPVAEVSSGKGRRNDRDCKRKFLPLPDILSSYCPAERRVDFCSN